MALTYVGGAEGSSSADTFDITLPAGMQAGDLVIVATGFGSDANRNPGVSTTGYTEVADLYSNDNFDANFSVNYKIMGATPDSIVTCLGETLGNGAVGVVHVWRGADQTTPMDTATTTATGINSSVPNSPSITPVTSGAIVIATGLGTTGSVDNSVTAPTGYGNQVDISVTGSFTPCVVGIASKAWSGSGAEDPAVWTNWTTSTSDSWCAATLAIRPAADTGNSLSVSSAGTLTGNGASTIASNASETAAAVLTGRGAATAEAITSINAVASITFTGQGGIVAASAVSETVVAALVMTGETIQNAAASETAAANLAANGAATGSVALSEVAAASLTVTGVATAEATVSAPAAAVFSPIGSTGAGVVEGVFSAEAVASLNGTGAAVVGTALSETAASAFAVSAATLGIVSGTADITASSALAFTGITISGAKRTDYGLPKRKRERLTQDDEEIMLVIAAALPYLEAQHVQH